MTLCRRFKRTILGKYNINSIEHNYFFYRNTVESIYTDIPENEIILALKTEPSKKSSEMTILLAKGALHIRLYHWIILLEVNKGLIIFPFICSFH